MSDSYKSSCEIDSIKKSTMVEIVDVIVENPFVKTLVLNINLSAEPGQFVMLWLPGIDEKPMSIRKTLPDKNRLHVTIEARGDCTTQMTSMKPGDKLGIRGPYGKAFTLEQDCIMVGGGVGMPPVTNLYEAVGGKAAGARLLQGARNKDRLLFTKVFPEMIIATDDGSTGHHGYVTDLLEQEIEKKKPKIVYTCGPELMMVKVMEICKRHGVQMEASLERYMRCGVGVCGSCVCGKSVVCIDGPIFSIDQLENNPEFGKFELTKSAKKVPLGEQ